MPGFQAPHHVLLLKLQETTVAVFLLLPQLSPAFLLLLLALRALRCLTSAFFRSFFLSLPPSSRALAPCCLRFSASVSLWLLLVALIMSCPWLIVMTSLSGATRNWHLFAFAAAFSCLLALAPGPSRPPSLRCLALDPSMIRAWRETVPHPSLRRAWSSRFDDAFCMCMTLLYMTLLYTTPLHDSSTRLSSTRLSSTRLSSTWLSSTWLSCTWLSPRLLCMTRLGSIQPHLLGSTTQLPTETSKRWCWVLNSEVRLARISRATTTS